MNTLTVAILSISLSVIAQFCLKIGMSNFEVKTAMSLPFSIHSTFIILINKFVLGGFLLYGLGAVIWLGVLSKWDVSKAYPLVGLGFVFTAIIGLLVGEQVTFQRGVGIALISLGVLLVGRS